MPIMDAQLFARKGGRKIYWLSGWTGQVLVSPCKSIAFIDHKAIYCERVHPMGDQSIPERGVLATRSPCLPNPVGITVAEILSAKGNAIRVTGLDALKGTPILDIKPYDEHFDSHVGIEIERSKLLSSEIR